MDKNKGTQPETSTDRLAFAETDMVLSEECRRVLAAQRILSVRKLREVEFNLSVIGEPGFCMLLELHVLEAAGNPACLKALEQAAGVPVSVAARWLKALEVAGLTTCERGHAGEPQTLIEITPLGHAKLARYLDSIAGFVTKAPS